YHDFPISHSSKQDSESGYHYFGARYYDSELLTGWMSVDPMSDKYPSISPYAYCAWNPVKLVDPDGREVVLPLKKEWAERLVSDLNRIYKSIYNTKINAFSAQQVKDIKGNVYYRLKANKDFDWRHDKYTRAMKECIDDPEKVFVKIVDNNNPNGPGLSRGRKVHDFVNELGGGQFKGQYIYLSKSLSNYSKENSTAGKFAKKHCLGGVFMHELLFHAHIVGLDDMRENKQSPSSEMQNFYLLHHSNAHNPGSNQIFPSRR
ncbi:MAG: RHS repeat-associated core domain-containing protein, partial [archaeon]|nr:RHS repeat-associated core domain-containing protein [archaeon]